MREVILLPWWWRAPRTSSAAAITSSSTSVASSSTSAVAVPLCGAHGLLLLESDLRHGGGGRANVVSGHSSIRWVEFGEQNVVGVEMRVVVRSVVGRKVKLDSDLFTPSAAGWDRGALLLAPRQAPLARDPRPTPGCRGALSVVGYGNFIHLRLWPTCCALHYNVLVSVMRYVQTHGGSNSKVVPHNISWKARPLSQAQKGRRGSHDF